jgi:hypothetical protein
MASMRDWLWVLLLAPLWVIGTTVSIAFAVGAERVTKTIISEAFYVWSAVAGAVLALVALALVDCVFHTGLPFSNPLCRMLRL